MTKRQTTQTQRQHSQEAKVSPKTGSPPHLPDLQTEQMLHDEFMSNLEPEQMDKLAQGLKDLFDKKYGNRKPGE